jgi:hypothetical protein
MSSYRREELERMYLAPSPRRSFEHLLLSAHFSFPYVDLLQPVDLPVLVELNGGFDIDVLLFGLIVRVVRI